MVQYGKTEDFILRKGEHMNLLSFFVVEIRPDGSRLRVAIKSNTEYFILNIRDDLLMERRIEYSGRLITGCRKYLNYRRI